MNKEEKRKIPNEILIKILQQVPRKSLHQYIYVNKAWSSLAIQEYYKKLYLNDKNTDLLKPLLQDSLPTTTERGESWT